MCVCVYVFVCVFVLIHTLMSRTVPVAVYKTVN